ncbi:hypothetical protein QCA50_003753 [Cerrena zonata]|uniref:Uncharacterized protein n=1 Tax=Cerrena zonata TaxID=2478898 RepID=A0AAW0GLX7_9APHY
MYAHFDTIKYHPIWGVIIGGPRCGTFMAWRSSANNRAYIIQRAIRVYDISVPYEAMQFALFPLQVQESR